MRKRFERTPRHYDGSKLTTHHASQISSNVLVSIREVYQERPDLVLAAWPEVIGPQLSKMTQAISFIDGILVVKVKNSTLHSLLSQRDKPKVLSSLRQKFPKLLVKGIIFRIG